jgi:hypothetical protein
LSASTRVPLPLVELSSMLLGVVAGKSFPMLASELAGSGAALRSGVMSGYSSSVSYGETFSLRSRVILKSSAFSSRGVFKVFTAGLVKLLLMASSGSAMGCGGNVLPPESS